MSIKFECSANIGVSFPQIINYEITFYGNENPCGTVIQQNIIKAAKRYSDERLADRSEKPALRQAQDKLGSL
ncbi:MAG: hypothetical protein WKF59_22440 [Chitinophagaceae bacterium]